MKKFFFGFSTFLRVSARLYAFSLLVRYFQHTHDVCSSVLQYVPSNGRSPLPLVCYGQFSRSVWGSVLTANGVWANPIQELYTGKELYSTLNHVTWVGQKQTCIWSLRSSFVYKFKKKSGVSITINQSINQSVYNPETRPQIETGDRFLTGLLYSESQKPNVLRPNEFDLIQFTTFLSIVWYSIYNLWLTAHCVSLRSTKCRKCEVFFPHFFTGDVEEQTTPWGCIHVTWVS